MVRPKTKDTLCWEWRTFSPSLADLEAKIGLAVQIAPHQSDEIYLLNSATPHSAKIRDAVLEVKRLVQRGWFVPRRSRAFCRRRTGLALSNRGACGVADHAGPTSVGGARFDHDVNGAAANFRE